MTTSPKSIYSAAVSGWWCCPGCDAVQLVCPGCAEPFKLKRPQGHPAGLPLHWAVICPDPACGAGVAVTVCGYRPNPTGDAPAIRWPLSDPLPVIERPRVVLPPSPPKPAADHARAERLSLADWRRRGVLPDGVSPGAVAAAYRRTFGTTPRRDRTRRAVRAYTARELGICLGQLGQPVRVDLQEVEQ